jgi:hypothetical protein
LLPTENSLRWEDTDEFCSMVFERPDAVRELYRAAEGNPRDALNIVARAVKRAEGGLLSSSRVTEASTWWYREAKIGAIDEADRDEMLWLLDALYHDAMQYERLDFLLPSRTTSVELQALYRARLVHQLETGLSRPGPRGRRYDHWSLDYGCALDREDVHRLKPGFTRIDPRILQLPTRSSKPASHRSLGLAASSSVLPEKTNDQGPLPPSIVEVPALPESGSGQVEPEREVPSTTNEASWRGRALDLSTAVWPDGPHLVIFCRDRWWSHYIGEEPIRIGRAPDADIRLEDPYVSREHARVTRAAGTVHVQDCNSSHGLSVNGKRIASGEIGHGDELSLGDSVLVLVVVH